MKILVIGGTGQVGTHLVANLVQRGLEPTVLVRSADRIAAVQAGAIGVATSLVDDPDGSASAFAGIEAVFMLNRPGEFEAIEGLIALELARRAGVRRFVYQSSHLAEDRAHIPHVGSKTLISKAVIQSGLDYSFICPNHFFQNDLRAKTDLLEHGRYADPLGDVGCWGIDSRDIAEAAATVLTTEGHSGQSYNLVGPENITGESRAAMWTKALGRPIRYEGDVDKWRAGLWSGIPRWLAFDLAMMYRNICDQGMLGTPADLERLTLLLGRSPRSFQAFADECAAEWGVKGG